MVISVIVTTYNRPDALRAVLGGLFAQTDCGFEVLIADDGSTTPTRALVDAAATASWVPVGHVWQEDLGFRAGAARNRAAARACGDYLVFLDGDCVPRMNFVAQHRALAESGWMVAGNRVLFSETFTHTVLAEQLPVHTWTLKHWRALAHEGAINRTLPLRHVPLGRLRKLGASRWQRVRTCNLGMWTRDFHAVNGFDEAYEGWGFEDSDLAVRLINAGVQRKEGGFATTVLHLWHAENDRRNASKNLELLNSRMAARVVRAAEGIDRCQPAPATSGQSCAY